MPTNPIQPGSVDYPPALLRADPGWKPSAVYTIGNTAILRQRVTALYCSTKCPGQVILKAFSRVAHLRDAGHAFIGGFHTPIEKECLRILLRGASPVAVCPARSLDRFRVPAAWKPAIDTGRLLLVSPFAPGSARATADLAQHRNEFVARLAFEILLLYVTPGGRLESFVRDLEQSGRRVRRLDEESGFEHPR